MEELALFLENKQILMKDCDFKQISTIGVGGVCKAVFPRSFTELIDVIEQCNRLGLPVKVLGNLSNVLPPEREGKTVFVMTRLLRGLTFGESPLVHAGVTSGELLKACRENGKGGAEFLAGIPCTIGGAAYMNAGVSGRYFADVVRSVVVYEDGALKTYLKEECDYSYKHSRFMSGGVILGVILDLKDASEEEIVERTGWYLQRRKRLPKGRSMGCIFKNPEGCFAGELIENAGLKGLRQGGAVVSSEHANFIINDGEATVADVKRLIAKIKRAVYDQSGVRLEEEICYL